MFLARLFALRISKFILPFLKGKYFIDTTLLSDLKVIPEDLENYVLKPLFSFSGSGVIFHVKKKEDIEAVVKRALHSPEKSKLYSHSAISRRKSKMRSARALRLEKRRCRSHSTLQLGTIEPWRNDWREIQ